MSLLQEQVDDKGQLFNSFSTVHVLCSIQNPHSAGERERDLDLSGEGLLFLAGERDFERDFDLDCDLFADDFLGGVLDLLLDADCLLAGDLSLDLDRLCDLERDLE